MKFNSLQVVENMERETRIELATNSLEGCDSTIELLPPTFSVNHLQCTTSNADAPSWYRSARPDRCGLCTKRKTAWIVSDSPAKGS